MELIITILIGGVSGWLAGMIMGTKHSVIINIIIGLVGGALGGFLGGLIGVGAAGWIGRILIAVCGSCLLIFICKKLFK